MHTKFISAQGYTRAVLLYLAVSVLCLIPEYLNAQEAPLERDPMGVIPDDWEEPLEASLASLNETLQDTVNYFDTFFVDNRFDHEFRGNRFRYRSESKLEEREGFDTSPRFRLHVKLPNTRNRWNLVVGTFDTDRPNQGRTLTDNRDEEVFAGFRNFLTGDSLGKAVASFDVGARVTGDALNLVSRLRFRYGYAINNWVVRTVPVAFVRSDEGFGSSLGIDINRVFSVEGLLRNRTEVIYSEETIKEDRDVTFTNELSLFSLPSEKRGYRATLFVEGQTRGPDTITDYETLVSARQAIFNDTIYLEVGPGLAWRAQHDFETSALVRINLEIIIGGPGGRRLKNLRDDNKRMLSLPGGWFQE